jgi:signal peptidase I
VNFLKKRKARKLAHELLRHSRHVRNMREDILAAERLTDLDAKTTRLEATLKPWTDVETVEAAMQALSDTLNQVAPVAKGGGLRENFEIILVAIAVAMAVRSYFIQPFKIPTGSMQPTLYGITSVEKSDPGIMDHFPLKQIKFMGVGKLYVERRAKADGIIRYDSPKSTSAWDRILPLKLVKLLTTGQWFAPHDPSVKYLMIGTSWHKIPIDALRRSELKVSVGSSVKKGDLLWSGIVTRGDHVFVNKLIWNFRKPKRGEIMVFSTTGIAELVQGTHYIKRMCGLPNDSVSIRPPNLVINGEVVTEPETIAKNARQDPGYDGYQLAGKLNAENLAWPLQADQYFALGDNTGNSKDSRYWGPVPSKNLVGPAVIIYWPLSSRWGLAH